MSTDTLLSLIAGAVNEARPRFACDDGEHIWTAEGGRRCPMGAEGCSQTVYRCEVCGQYDYGSGDDSPGELDCKVVCGDSMMGWRGGHLDPESEERDA